MLSRFRYHLESKEMTAGTVVFRCNTSDVMGWEKAAVRVLLGLRGRERLCVRNVAPDARGALPASDESAVYLTWRVLDDIKPITPPVRRDISVLAHELSSQLDGTSRDTLERVLDPITRPATEQADLAWFEGHRRPACDEAAGR